MKLTEENLEVLNLINELVEKSGLPLKVTLEMNSPIPPPQTPPTK